MLDRTAPDVVDRLVAVLSGHRFVGALAVGTGSAAPCVAVVRRLDGGRTVVSASTAVSLDRLAPGRGVLLRALPLLLRTAARETAIRLRARAAGVRPTTVRGSALRHSAVGPAVWQDYLPTALADGAFRPTPEPMVAGDGLGALQTALDLQRRGVSARKVVVTL